jgi:hypothetical protein
MRRALQEQMKATIQAKLAASRAEKQAMTSSDLAKEWLPAYMSRDRQVQLPAGFPMSTAAAM